MFTAQTERERERGGVKGEGEKGKEGEWSSGMAGGGVEETQHCSQVRINMSRDPMSFMRTTGDQIGLHLVVLQNELMLANII